MSVTVSVWESWALVQTLGQRSGKALQAVLAARPKPGRWHAGPAPEEGDPPNEALTQAEPMHQPCLPHPTCHGQCLPRAPLLGSKCPHPQPLSQHSRPSPTLLAMKACGMLIPQCEAPRKEGLCHHSGCMGPSDLCHCEIWGWQLQCRPEVQVLSSPVPPPAPLAGWQVLEGGLGGMLALSCQEGHTQLLLTRREGAGLTQDGPEAAVAVKIPGCRMSPSARDPGGRQSNSFVLQDPTWVSPGSSPRCT